MSNSIIFTGYELNYFCNIAQTTLLNTQGVLNYPGSLPACRYKYGNYNNIACFY